MLVVLLASCSWPSRLRTSFRRRKDFESWTLPGGAGVIGILLAQFFNSPRQNARDDLAALVNLQRPLSPLIRAEPNQIDATFKHGYIESRQFGRADMLATVTAIQDVFYSTLDKAAQHLRVSGHEHPRQEPSAWKPKPAEPNGDQERRHSAPRQRRESN